MKSRVFYARSLVAMLLLLVLIPSGANSAVQQVSSKPYAVFQSTKYKSKEPISVSDYKGKGLVLVFGRTTCGYCHSAMKFLIKHLSSLREAGTEIVISLDGLVKGSNNKAFDNIIKAKGWGKFQFACYSNSDMWANLYKAGNDSNYIIFPVIFIINQNGKIINYSTNFLYTKDQQKILKAAYKVAPNP